jgi:hypothetical protein
VFPTPKKSLAFCIQTTKVIYVFTLLLLEIMSLYSRIAWVASTILMIAVNTLAVTLPINDVSTKQLSDTLSTLITPIGWTFSIWSVIYLGLIAIAVWIIWKQINVSRQIVRTYIISCICNAAWIVVWHYGYLTAAMLIIL